MRRIFATTAAAAALAIWAVAPADAATGWSQQATPNPPAAVNSMLASVACPAASNCMAVGSYVTKASQFGLAEHWNGSKWVIESNPSGAGELGGVACPSATDCIAVGGASGDGLIGESWNGSAWTAHTVPAPSGMSSGSLNGIQCSSTSSCFAVGTFTAGRGSPKVLIEHWNGSTWSVQTVPARPGTMFGVSCQSVKSCFAVGTDGDTQLVLVEHYNGASWVVQGTPTLPKIEGEPPGNAALSGISCAGATDCMATGSVSGQFSTPESTPTDTLSELWNGKKWVLETTPNPGGSRNRNELDSVSCTPAANCTATGGSTVDNDFPDIAMAATWNGKKWTNSADVADPSDGIGSELDGVTCAAVCTAVGDYIGSSGTNLTLAERN